MDANPDAKPAAASATATADSRGYALSGKVMLVSTVVLFSAVLFLLFLHLYLRSRFLLRRRRARRLRRRLSFPIDPDRLQPPSSPAADRRGLDPGVLKSLPVLVFAAAAEEDEEEEEEPAECAVCLSEFEDGEKTRALPRCGHRFHIECIDMWFRSHATCPLCRSSVETGESAALPAAANRAATTSEASPLDPEMPTPGSDGPEALGSSSAGRGSDGELGMGLKSLGSRMLLLTRLLSRDSRSCRGGGGGGGGGAGEPDLERGVGQAPAAAPAPAQYQ